VKIICCARLQRGDIAQQIIGATFRDELLRRAVGEGGQRLVAVPEEGAVQVAIQVRCGLDDADSLPKKILNAS
jgi:hypothetical protein